MSKLNWKIVDRYFAGEASDAERTLVERWLAEAPAFRELVQQFYRNDVDDAMVRSEQKLVEARLAKDIAASRRRHFPRRFVTAIRTGGGSVLKAAAVVGLLLGGSLVILQVVRTGDHAPINISRTASAEPGERSRVRLPDGSRVVLSPGSSLEYASEFGAAARREVRLVGEAYFDVRHDRRRPFVVHAGNLVAEDLGTQFVVRAYPEDSIGRVIVREGLVGIGQSIVSPGEMGWVANGTPVVKPVDVASWFSWMDGQLVFDSMPLAEALPKLRRWYGRELKLADASLGTRVLVGSLPESDADDEALHAVALALGLDLAHRGDTLVFVDPASSPTPLPHP